MLICPMMATRHRSPDAGCNSLELFAIFDVAWDGLITLVRPGCAGIILNRSDEHSVGKLIPAIRVHPKAIESDSLQLWTDRPVSSHDDA
jgi:hypothetical protein